MHETPDDMTPNYVGGIWDFFLFIFCTCDVMEEGMKNGTYGQWLSKFFMMQFQTTRKFLSYANTL